MPTFDCAYLEGAAHEGGGERVGQNHFVRGGEVLPLPSEQNYNLFVVNRYPLFHPTKNYDLFVVERFYACAY